MVQQKPPGCEGCPLEGAEGPVFGVGPPRAKLAIIAESPGRNEVAWCRRCWELATPDCLRAGHPIGAPLVGGSGRVTASLCGNAGVDWQATYKTNIVKCRPEGDGDVPEGAISQCHRLLVDELSRVQPDVLILMGGVALGLVAPGAKITNWQGSV